MADKFRSRNRIGYNSNEVKALIAPLVNRDMSEIESALIVTINNDHTINVCPVNASAEDVIAFLFARLFVA